MQVGSLTMNAELSSMAQQWAEHLLLINTLKHSNDKYRGQPVGENVAAKSGSRTVDFTGIIFIITYSLLNEEKSVSAGSLFQTLIARSQKKSGPNNSVVRFLIHHIAVAYSLCFSRSFVFTVTRPETKFSFLIACVWILWYHANRAVVAVSCCCCRRRYYGICAFATDFGRIKTFTFDLF